MTLNTILTTVGGGLWKILIAVAAIVFIVVFFDYLKRVAAAVGEFFSGVASAIRNYRQQKRESSEGKATLPHIVVFVIAVLIVIYALGLIVRANYTTPVDLTAQNGAIAMPFSASDDATFETREAEQAVLYARD